MTIRMSCPNGHKLKIKDELAGKIGRCPACKAKFLIPRLEAAPVSSISEDEIIDVLAPDDPTQRRDFVDLTQSSLGGDSSDSILSLNRQGFETPKKVCHVCHQEIDAKTHICPHCHHYIAQVSDL